MSRTLIILLALAACLEPYCSWGAAGADAFRRAAEQGDAKAQFSLGWCYSKGEGVAKDTKKAVAWYRKAAEQGDMAAQYAL